MSEADDRCRELAVDPKDLERIADDARPWRGHERTRAESEAQSERAEVRSEAIAMLALVIETRLTVSQREIVDLYFYQEKTQEEIAVILGISQQVVSKQLFGVMRQGKKVGGAIRKLRKLLEKSGIKFE